MLQRCLDTAGSHFRQQDIQLRTEDGTCHLTIGLENGIDVAVRPQIAADGTDEARHFLRDSFIDLLEFFGQQLPLTHHAVAGQKRHEDETEPELEKHTQDRAENAKGEDGVLPRREHLRSDRIPCTAEIAPQFFLRSLLQINEAAGNGAELLQNRCIPQISVFALPLTHLPQGLASAERPVMEQGAFSDQQESCAEEEGEQNKNGIHYASPHLIRGVLIFSARSTE